MEKCRDEIEGLSNGQGLDPEASGVEGDETAV
jgi:hypothetical protein